MAKLYISEFATQAHQLAGAEPVASAQEPSITNQTPITIGATSAASAAFNGATRLIRVHTDAICSIFIGAPIAAKKRFTGSAGTNLFNVGGFIYVGATWAARTKTGKVLAIGGTAADPVITYELIGDTDFANLDSVKERNAMGDADGDATCTAGAPAAFTGDPEATANHARLAANATEYFGVRPGDQLAVITNT